VLAPDDHAAWLDPAVDGEAARALLGRPDPEADWIREPVSTWVNKADHDDPRCVEPPAGDAQPTLFE
jgi:putative SOS response-associated peptidase YedK